MSESAKRGGHASYDQGRSGLIGKAKRCWERSSALQAAALALVLAAAFAALFWFAVFGDFGGSADFVYNQF